MGTMATSAKRSTGRWLAAGLAALLVAAGAPLLAQQGHLDETKVEKTCEGHLGALYSVLSDYAAQHDGALPARLSTLWDDHYLLMTVRFFWCPEDPQAQVDARNIDRNASYELVATRLAPTTQAVLVQEKDFRHRTAEGREYRNRLLQNGTIVRDYRAEVVSTVTEVPTAQFDTGQRTTWDQTDCISYHWHTTNKVPAGKTVEFQPNFVVDGLLPWRKDTGVSLGRQRPGTYFLEVCARIDEWQGPQARIDFRVEPGAQVVGLPSADRLPRVKTKSPLGNPITSKWPLQATALRSVRIDSDQSVASAAGEAGNDEERPRTTEGKPERSHSTGSRAHADKGDTGDDNVFDGDPEDPHLFLPRGVGRKKALLVQSPIETLVITCTMTKTEKDEPVESLRCELFRGGESISKPQKVDSTARLQAVYFQTNATSYLPGRYSVRITKEGELVCELGFNIVTPRPPPELYQKIGRAVTPAEWQLAPGAKDQRVPEHGFACGASLPPPEPLPKPAVTTTPAPATPKPTPGGAGKPVADKPTPTPVTEVPKPVSKPAAVPRDPKAAKYMLSPK